MGWNDHVEIVEMTCLDCGKIADWEMWDEIAKARYGGDLGRKLGHDMEKNDGRCPHCGSQNGRETEADDW